MAADPMVPSDTTPDAHRLQGRIYREMGGASRLGIAFAWSHLTRQLTEAGIRRRHPEYSDDQVMRARARITMGDELTRAAWPAHDLVDP